MKKIGIFFLFLLGACVSSKPVVTEDYNYSERISKFRPEFEVIDLKNFAQQSLTEAQNQKPVVIKTSVDSVSGSGEVVNKELHRALDKITENNKKIRYVMGYSVQVYSGQDRDEANRIMKELSQFTTQEFNLKYEEPSFKVMVGNFFTRYEAHLAYSQLKGVYPNAITLVDKITLYRKE